MRKQAKQQELNEVAFFYMFIHYKPNYIQDFLLYFYIGYL